MKNKWFYNGADAYDPDLSTEDFEKEIELLKKDGVRDQDIEQYKLGWQHAKQQNNG